MLHISGGDLTIVSKGKGAHMNEEIDVAYQKVLNASQVQPADDALAALKKLLAQANIDLGMKDQYISGLKQRLAELQQRVEALEAIVSSKGTS